jgi:hypothetical protein
MTAYLSGLGPWAWIILGVALMGLELAAPGGVLLWLGLAAVATGGLAALTGMAWQGAMLAFVLIAPSLVLAGRRFTRGADDATAGDLPHLNRRAGALIGRVFTLEGPMVHGEGRVRVGDSSWRVVGPDLPAGGRVRVLRVEGATLVVEGA